MGKQGEIPSQVRYRKSRVAMYIFLCAHQRIYGFRPFFCGQSDAVCRHCIFLLSKVMLSAVLTGSYGREFARKKLGNNNLKTAQNPVFVISGGGRNV